MLQIFLTTLFSGLLFLVKYPYWFELSLGILLINIFPSYKTIIAAVITLYFWMYLDLPFQSFSLVDNLISRLEISYSPIQLLLFKLTAMILAGLYFFLFTKWKIQTLKKTYLRIYVFLISNFLLICILSVWGQDTPYVFALFIAAVIHFQWFFCFVLLQQNMIPLSLNTIFFYVFPFWSPTSIPVAFPSQIETHHLDQSAKNRIRWTGIRLIAIYAVFFYLGIVFIRLVESFNSEPVEFFNIPDQFVFYSIYPLKSYNSLLSNSYSLMQTVAVVFKLAYRYLLYNVLYHLILAVSAARLMGIPLASPIQNFFLSKSFNDFFRRILFYYSNIIIHIFYIPLMAFTKKIKYGMWKVILLNVLSISLMGIFYHFGRNFYIGYLQGIGPITMLSWKQSYYYLAIAAISGVSVYISETRPKSRSIYQSQPKMILYNTLTLIFICLLATMVYDLDVLKILLYKISNH